MTGPRPTRPDLLPPPAARTQGGTQAQSRDRAGWNQSPSPRAEAGRAGVGAVVLLGALVPGAGEVYAPVYPLRSPPASAPQVLADVHVFLLVSEGIWGGLGGQLPLAHGACGAYALHLLGEVLRVLPDGLGQLRHRVQHQVVKDHLRGPGLSGSPGALLKAPPWAHPDSRPALGGGRLPPHGSEAASCWQASPHSGRSCSGPSLGSSGSQGAPSGS